MKNSRTMIALIIVFAGLLGVAAFGASAPSTVATEPTTAAGQVGEQPNIVLINLDDADIDLLDDWALEQYFPNIKTLIADEGLRFENFHVVAPLCGPSRGALFRGQYPHNTGIIRNQLGWEVFYDRGYTDAEIGQWMREAGYSTALVGKYCHEEYPSASHDEGYVPPGWDNFHASLGGNYFGTPRNVNGDRVRNGSDVYRTDVERSSAKALVAAHDTSKPLFLYVAPFAPHGTNDERGMVAPRFSNSFSDVIVPRTPDFDEADVSDKTPQYQQLPHYGDAAGEQYDFRYRRRIQAMLAVDQLVGELFASLETKGMLDNTYVMLTSDNGFQTGHHRTLFKKDPFDRVTRVQLLVRGPNVPKQETTGQLLGHIDLVPTLLDLGGSKAPELVDGKSFAALLENPDAAEDDEWRDSLLIENVQGKVVNGVELDVNYVALRRFDDVYVEWANGDREYYNLAEDPFQLENSWSSLSATQRVELATELDALRNCAGPTCRGGSALPRVDTISHAGNALTIPRSVTLTGTATAARGVDAVDVVVRRVRDRTYWNGERFQRAYVSVDALFSSGGPGSTSTAWSLPVNLQQGEEYWTSARATDIDGNSDPIADTGFFTAQSDRSNPTISAIAISQDSYGGFTVSGTAGDDLAVSHVLLQVTDAQTGHFWDGREFNAQERSITASAENPFSASSPWVSSTQSLPPGSYNVRAAAIDAAGKRSEWTSASEFDLRAICNNLRASLVGTLGDDTLVGTDGDDVINGLAGHDTIDGLGGDDTICGGPGDDTIIGGPGQDFLFGNGGADTIDGDEQ